ncbi:MAG: MBL fold metallo-hydrolase [Rikenellaceae bacterium]|nr:MBL fold metallo-hydrolase [Rikenellaceae bacterium]MCL2693331.1 MBL fold metallo-hydrolase [Rikenellaceae bacterium]
MALNIATFVFNPFRENTYVVWDETGECAVIDAGNYSAAEDRALAEFFAEKKLKPVLALNTHGHVDHILGVHYLATTYDTPLAMHGDDGFLVDSCVEYGRIYGFEVAGKPAVSRDLKGEDEVRFGNTTLKIIHTPGHTPGHVCFYEPESKALFTGDTLFRESIGRTDLPGGDYRWIMQSIIDLLLPLGGDVAIYPGHGPSSTLGHEALYNPFVTEVLGG